MKTIFSMGFPGQANFWMGQASGTVTSGGLDYALDLYKKIQDWVAKTSNAAALLGSNYQLFLNAKSKSDSLYSDVVDFGETLDTGGTLSDAENAEANQFYDATTIAWAYINQAPTTVPAAAPSGPSAAQQITSAATQVAKAIGPKAPPAKPGAPAPAPAAPAPASNLTTPLLIGGGALAVLIAVVAASKS